MASYPRPLTVEARQGLGRACETKERVRKEGEARRGGQGRWNGEKRRGKSVFM